MRTGTFPALAPPLFGKTQYPRCGVASHASPQDTRLQVFRILFLAGCFLARLLCQGSVTCRIHSSGCQSACICCYFGGPRRDFLRVSAPDVLGACRVAPLPMSEVCCDAHEPGAVDIISQEPESRTACRDLVWCAHAGQSIRV